MAKQNQNIPIVIPGGQLNNFLNNFSEKISNFLPSKKNYLILLIAGLLLLAIYKKDWFIAAMVNGMPVTNLELQIQLNKQFRTQTLNQLIDKKIIIDEARKNKAIPTETEIDQKIKDLETQYGGAQNFNSLLSQQGLTKSSIRDQIRIPLMITRLYENEATVSAMEVTKYIADNKDQMKATDSAQQQIEATESLKQQKLSQIFSQKFQELRKKAKIQIF